MLQDGVANILVSFITQVLPPPAAAATPPRAHASVEDELNEAVALPVLPLPRPERGDPLTDSLRKSYRAAMLLAGPEPTEALGVFVESRAQLLFKLLFEVEEKNSHPPPLPFH
jgi:hypothetical protein